MLVPLVLVLTLHAADQNDAEKQFRQMEMKLRNAKTLECTFETKLEGGPEKGEIKGEVTLGEGNKNLFEMSGEIGGKRGKTTIVSNGVKLVIVETDKPKQTNDVGKSHNDIFRASLARTGLLVPLFFVMSTKPPKDFKIDDDYKVSDFKLGKKEKVGDKEAQVIEYKFHIKGMDEPLMTSVWVDTKTNLPLKRVVTGKLGNQSPTITETYSKLNVDEKVDTKKFELPKE